MDNVRDRALDKFLAAIKGQIEPVEELFTYYRCAIMEVETKFKVLNEQFSLQYDNNPIENIKSRIKSYDSILKKAKRKGVPLNIDAIANNIFDIAGIRVICSFEKDIYLLADYLLAQDDITLIERKDYIKNPKESGYRSLHLIVEVPIFLSTGKKMMKVEVQLRTIAMDFWASLEHKLRYKKDISDDQMEMLSAEMKKCAEMTTDLDHRMQRVRDSLTRDVSS